MLARLFIAAPIAFLGVAISGYAVAADGACRARSDYDITVAPAALQFERKNAPSQSIEMHGGTLAVDRKPVPLRADDRKRVQTFETKVRELVPKIKALGRRSVDLMVGAIREEAARASPRSAVDPELNARIDARAQELKQRIAQSRTSKEWRPDAIAGYMTGVIADVAPLITGDLTQKAVDLTMKGDLGGVIALKDEAINLKQSLERHIHARLDTLQPEIDRLCPSLREIDRLESGVTGTLPDGKRLNLIEVGEK